MTLPPLPSRWRFAVIPSAWLRGSLLWLALSSSASFAANETDGEDEPAAAEVAAAPAVAPPPIFPGDPPPSSRPPPPELSDRPSGSDPKRCRVMLEDLGDVGLRISDAQALATDVLGALRARVGQDGAAYEGLLKSQKKLKKLLGTRAEVQVQKDQIRYLEECMKHAPFRMRVSFGKRKQKKHKKSRDEEIALTCTRAGERTPLHERLIRGPSFEDARARLREAIVDFCPELEGDPQPTGGEPPTRRESDRWLLPPRR